MSKIKWITIAAILSLVLPLGILLVPAHPALALIPTVWVSATLGNDAYDGSQPLHTTGNIGPKRTIDQGRQVAADSGTIRVAAGTYNEHLSFDRTVAIIGTGAQYTIIDASGGNWNAVQATGNPGGTVNIAGVTIQNGNYNSGPGGVTVDVDWTVIMFDCVIKNNTGQGGGGIGVASNGTLELNRCTVSGNHATKPGTTGGGGIFNWGTATMNNCTISGNDATGYGGGLRNSTGASMTLTNCTVAHNGVYGGAGLGGGFYNGGAGATMTFKNTIVANNNASSSGHNGNTGVGASTISQGYNLDSENSCNFTSFTDQRNTALTLGPLQDNGGTGTFTHALLPGSPAIDKGGDPWPPSDQRLVPRPQPPGGVYDIGAYELIQESALTVATATGTGTATFSTNSGLITDLTAATSTPCGTLSGVTFLHGFFSFTITIIPVGSTVTVTITLPSNMPVGTEYWKCISGQWVNATSLIGHNDGDNILTLTITDGSQFDADGQVNGTIVDPGGPSIVPISTTIPAKPSASPSLPRQLKPAQMSVQYLSVSSQQAQANQPVTITTNVVNTGDEAGNLNVALKINGQVEQTRMVSVGPLTTQPIKFTVTRAQPGTYSIDIGGQKGSFIVLGNGSTAHASVNGGLIVILLMGILILATVVVLVATRRRPA